MKPEQLAKIAEWMGLPRARIDSGGCGVVYNLSPIDCLEFDPINNAADAWRVLERAISSEIDVQLARADATSVLAVLAQENDPDNPALTSAGSVAEALCLAVLEMIEVE